MLQAISMEYNVYYNIMVNFPIMCQTEVEITGRHLFCLCFELLLFFPGSMLGDK